MKKQILSKVMIAFMVANFSMGGISTIASASDNVSTSTPGNDSDIYIESENTYDSSVSSTLDEYYSTVGTLKAGSSIKVTNLSTTVTFVLLNQDSDPKECNIDAVQYDSYGDYYNYDYEKKKAVVSVKKGGYTIITNNGSSDVVFCVDKNNAQFVKVESSSSPAYEKYVLKAGQKYEITNTNTKKDEKFAFTSGETRGYFDAVTIDSSNKVEDAEIAETNVVLDVPKGGKIRILPKKDMTIGIPYTVRKNVSIKTTKEGILTSYILKSGQTYTLTKGNTFVPVVKKVKDNITATSGSKVMELKDCKGIDLFRSTESVNLKNNESKDVTIWLPSAVDNEVTIKSASGVIADKSTSEGGSDSGTVVPGNGESNINPLTTATAPSNFTYEKYKTINKKYYIEITGYIGKDENVVIPDQIDGINVLSIKNGIFVNNNIIKNITLPSKVTDIGAYPFKGCSNLKSINISTDNETYSTKNGVLFNKNMTQLICVPGALEGTYEIPSSVTNLANYSFYGCSKITNINIPASVKTIGLSVFCNCSSLTNLNINEGITQLQSGEFTGCKNLTELYIPESVTNIDRNCFDSSSKKIIICCVSNSEAEKFAKEENIAYKNVPKGYVTVNTEETPKLTPPDSGDKSSLILPLLMITTGICAYKFNKKIVK